MKNSLLKWYMFAFLFVGSFVMFAQTTDPDDDEACVGPDCPPLEGDQDTDPTPINAKLIYLAIVAVVFAYFYFKNNSQKKVQA